MMVGIQNRIANNDPLTKDEIVFLLGLSPLSPEIGALGEQMRKRRQAVGNRGKVWGAIGLDYRACEMNCRFCSLGTDIHDNDEVYELSSEEILSVAGSYLEKGVDWLVLRTTEAYELEKLLAVVRKVKAACPEECVLTVNTGNDPSKRAAELKRAGTDMVYHAIRLREEVDTRFSKADREDTLQQIQQAGLLLSQYLEPIGAEHTDEELAERILEMRHRETDVIGVMPRVPVAGTAKEGIPMLRPERIAQITAVLQAAYGRPETDVIIHPFCEEALRFGANALVVDIGAIPRAKEMTLNEWDGQDVDLAKQRLAAAGYAINR